MPGIAIRPRARDAGHFGCPTRRISAGDAVLGAAIGTATDGPAATLQTGRCDRPRHDGAARRNTRATRLHIAAGHCDMAFLRSCIGLLVLCVVLSTGCSTTGGKVFGTAAVASGIASVYLMSTSRATIVNGQAVLQDDHTEAGAGLIFAAIAAASGWFLSECVFGKPWAVGGGGGGGGGGFPSSADPAGEPAAAPAPEPAPAGDSGAPAPVTIVVQAPDPAAQGPLLGWHLEPDGQDQLLDRAGELVIRIDRAGTVWNFGGAALGQVDMSGNCDVACRRARAHQMLRDLEQRQRPPSRRGGGRR
jgi:hypothetical protein